MWVLRGPDEQANLGQHKDPVVSLGNRSRVGEGEDCYGLDSETGEIITEERKRVKFAYIFPDFLA